MALLHRGPDSECGRFCRWGFSLDAARIGSDYKEQTNMEAVAWDPRSLVSLSVLLPMFTVALFVPFVKLLSRTGHNPAWSLFTFIPGLNLIAFWILAFKQWPTDNAKEQ
jgi:hypothetical protein